MSDNAGQAAAPTLRRIDVGYGRLEATLNFIAGGAIFVLMLVAVYQVVARTLFGTAIYGYIDYIEQSTAIFAFLGVAYCQKLGGHIRMEILLTVLPRRLLWWVEIFGIVTALTIIAVLIYGSYFNFLRAYELGDSTMDIRLPIWPSKLLVPIALCTLWLRLALQLVGYLRLAVHPQAEPVGVPTLHTPGEMAREEIEEALGRSQRAGRGSE
jgi:TRAP-type C4-dicarboxylate transport system permease small subunit